MISVAEITEVHIGELGDGAPKIAHRVTIPGIPDAFVYRCECGHTEVVKVEVTPDGFPKIRDITEAIRFRLLEAHIRTAAQQVGKSDLLRRSERLNPLDWRAQHRAIEGDLKAAVVKFGENMPDVRGRVGYPHKVYDTLQTLFRNGSITKDEMDAGRQFEELFRVAALDQLRAAKMEYSPRQGHSSGMPDAWGLIEYHRRIVHKALWSVGGWSSLAGASLWHVLGLGCTIKEFGERCQYGYGRSLHPHKAKAVFVGALRTLAEFCQGNVASTRAAAPKTKRPQKPRVAPKPLRVNVQSMTFPGGTLRLEKNRR